MEEKIFCVYILTNKYNRVLYTGVTSNLRSRTFQHSIKSVEGFTNRYNVDKLVYYEVCGNAEAAISREKQIKGGSRAKKLTLIQRMNPEWRDLSKEL